MKRLLFILAMLLPATAITGCGVFPWLAAQFAPPQTALAKYEIPKEKTVLVFPDDYPNTVSFEPVKRLLAERLNDLLAENEIAAAAIPYQAVEDMEAATNSFSGMSTSQIGKALGADIVIYVHIDKFYLKEDPANPLWHGYIETTVRVVDVNKGLIWPADIPGGWPVDPVDIPTDDTSQTYNTKLAQRLAEKMSEKIAHLFYEHTVPQRESRIQQERLKYD